MKYTKEVRSSCTQILFISNKLIKRIGTENRRSTLMRSGEK
jgi:hypothetical protein